MSQKSSFLQLSQSVSQALTPDSHAYFLTNERSKKNLNVLAKPSSRLRIEEIANVIEGITWVHFDDHGSTVFDETWVTENMHGEWGRDYWSPDRGAFWFADAEDAMMFKLRFG